MMKKYLIEVPPLVLSVIGGPPGANLIDPQIAIMEAARLRSFPGMPTFDVHGDGKKDWEVSVRAIATETPAYIRLWEMYLVREMCTEQHSIYGHVPTDVLIDYIEHNGGDATPILKAHQDYLDSLDGEGA